MSGILERLAEDARVHGWRQLAPCTEADPDIYFPEKGGNSRSFEVKLALSICGRCDFARECARLALSGQRDDDRDVQGIWGGVYVRRGLSHQRDMERLRQVAA